MKNFIALMMLFGLCSIIYSQNGCQPPTFYFDSMSTVSGTGGLNSVYKFTNVLNGVDAIMTITKAQNARSSSSDMDVTGNYPLAWQPNITFPASRTSMSDSSYLEFRIDFMTSSNQLLNQNCLAMTIVDCDGPNVSNSFREIVKVSLPGSPKGITSSTVSVYQDTKWIMYKSGPTTFMNIDTNNLAAMGQTNFPDTVHTFYMRVGVVGPIAANALREYSFYFKSFAGLVVPLPVKLINYRTSLVNRDGLVEWMASDEVNMDRYEVYRSTDGKDFVLAGTIKARKNQQISEYGFLDRNIRDYQNSKVYYRLKMIDQQELGTWGDISMLSLTAGGVLTYVYPNPATQALSVDLGYTPADGYSVEIVDVYGKAVIHNYDPELFGTILNLDIKALDKGLYFVNIYDSDGSVLTNRFIKH